VVFNQVTMVTILTDDGISSSDCVYSMHCNQGNYSNQGSYTADITTVATHSKRITID